MTVFITGATGYIGSHLAMRLAQSGVQVHALCRSEERGRLLEHPNIRKYYGDLHAIDVMDQAMQGCQQVYHVAAFARVWHRNPGTYYDINVSGTRHVLECCVRHRVEKVVFTSTGGVYGASTHGVITEDYIRQLDFFNEYEASKCLAESWVKDFVIQGLHVVIVSPTRVYGPYLFGSPESVTRMISQYVLGSWRWIPGPADKIGNYVYIDDVVTGHIQAMERGRAGQTYILGGTNHSYTEFFSLLQQVSGIRRRMIGLPLWLIRLIAWVEERKAVWLGMSPAMTPKWVAKARFDWEVDPSKSIREFDLQLVPLKEGLERTIAWLRS